MCDDLTIQTSMKNPNLKVCESDNVRGAMRQVTQSIISGKSLSGPYSGITVEIKEAI